MEKSSDNSEDDIFAETNETVDVEDVDLNSSGAGVSTPAATAAPAPAAEKLEPSAPPAVASAPPAAASAPPAAASAPAAPPASNSSSGGPSKLELPASLAFEYLLTVRVTNPEKIGDGMGAYVAYKVSFSTTIPAFGRPEGSVRRRFSDFLGLYEKLHEKYLRDGFVIPPKPEKSVVGATKIKMSKDSVDEDHFVERRRAQLERFLVRCSDHPVLRMDPDFREFLEHDGDLPKSSGTRALSGAGVMRVFSSIGSSVQRMTYKMDETDQWFEDKNQEVHQLEEHLRRLHSSIEALVNHRREYGCMAEQFAGSANMISSVEENTNLSFAFTKLAETEERVGRLQIEQADSDYYGLAELLHDHLAMLESVRASLYERVRAYKTWKDAEMALTKKREEKVRNELGGKADKAAACEAATRELEGQVERGQEAFDKISATVRSELERYDLRRGYELKTAIVASLEHQLRQQQCVLEAWEAYLPEAKRILAA
uniref:PX domain-containing protein n=1 Tax=Macrostomum lignano TaxID=282301 RepID=A0A1I8GBC6_9PLAT